MNDTFKAKLVYLTPVLASLLFGMICALILSTSSIELNRITPLPEEDAWPLLNAVYFVVLAGVGASILYLFLRRKNLIIIRFITGFALTTTIFLLSSIYLFAVFQKFSATYIEAFTMIVSISITIIAGYVIFKLQNRISNLIIIGIGGGLGTLMAASIPTLSAVLILCFLAVYDAFAVYRGPVGKIALEGLDKLPGLSFSFKNLQMGLGDLVFYSMLSGHILLHFGIFPSFASIIGILVGSFLSFKILETRDMFPGLPLPILLGLTAGFLTSIVR